MSTTQMISVWYPFLAGVFSFLPDCASQTVEFRADRAKDALTSRIPERVAAAPAVRIVPSLQYYTVLVNHVSTSRLT